MVVPSAVHEPGIKINSEWIAGGSMKKNISPPMANEPLESVAPLAHALKTSNQRNAHKNESKLTWTASVVAAAVSSGP